MNPGVWMAIFLLILSACAAPVTDKKVEQEPTESTAEYIEQPRLLLPGTFVGSIPCEDCLRVDIVLNLRPDMLYQLRKTYQTRQGVREVESQMRNWRYSSEGRMIILGKQKGMLKTYVVADQNTLVFLDIESEDVEPITYSLSRVPDYDPFRDNVKIRGMFSADESGATVAECSSGKTFGVARTGAFEDTVKEYLRLPHNVGEPLLLSFEGTLDSPAGEAGSPAEFITVNDFKRFYLNRDCLGQAVNASLTGTVWLLRSIGNRETNTFKYRSVPYLIMHSDNSLEAFGGCNTILGSYLVRGDVLLFNRMSQARVACFEGIELESLFLGVIDNAEFFEINGQTLEVLDQDGEVLATFTGV